ncbi:MBL fold metallo-hydrolase [Halobacillus amylolyticus]|uniref:MBL fold metallo-hydrolase n=1 Tax=Halobacillus amylolyticus TaxID=2932259 RepID=A0ABY4HCV0_9BACI|nr:MBL fold metallo-hydrolase [Halobacillus amylolyticus]UOR12093.1 MBL fold metallo-hydrolase [Halobacillus amylolyticus]
MSLRKATAKEIAQKVINRDGLFILDVRNESEFNDWRIEGPQVEVINKPYFELLEGVDPIIDKLPKDQQILVVCAKEGSSEFVGEMVVEAGFDDVMFMEGGMKSWSEHLEPLEIGTVSGGRLYQFVRIGKGCLSYLIESDGEAVIVDPARDIKVYEDFAAEKNLTIKHVIDTHLHADHISGGRTLQEKTGATYWLPPKDAESVNFSYQPLKEESDIVFGNGEVKVEVLYSPGHTIGSTSLIVNDQYLLTGDILFVASIGRPDLAGKAGDWASYLRETLYQRYKELSDQLIVLPAHFGQPSELNKDGSVQATLGTLYQENPGLKIDDESTFKKQVSENLPPQPNSYQDIRETNMGQQTPDESKQSEMEIGPNRCAVNG